MNFKVLIIMGLLFLSGVFLVLYEYFHHHFLPHLAAIPLEILFGVMLVEYFLKLKEKTKKKSQLLLIKSYVFRSEMRNLFICNINALQAPQINLSRLREMTKEELINYKDGFGDLVYKSEESLEKVIQEYLNTKEIFTFFMNWALENGFESIFEDMIYVLHFIQDVNQYNRNHPEKMFIQYAKKDPKLLATVRKFTRENIMKFFDYIIELKMTNPTLLDNMLLDYENTIAKLPPNEISDNVT